MDKCVWTTNETFTAEAEIAHFGPVPIENSNIVWSITYENGKQVASEQFPIRNIPIGNGTKLGTIQSSLSNVTAPTKLIVKISLHNTRYANHWNIWVYPDQLETTASADLLIADSLNEQVKDALKSGSKVLLLPALSSIASDIPAGFTTIFWNTQWTSRQPPCTLGILCDPNHHALAQFPTEFHSNWQWWYLITKSKSMILDDMPPNLRPIVQVIDDWNANRKLGLIFEAKVASGKLLVCSIDLQSNFENYPVTKQMFYSLLTYAGSDRFDPQIQCDLADLEDLFKASDR
jgi:hypothetical protein